MTKQEGQVQFHKLVEYSHPSMYIFEKLNTNGTTKHEDKVQFDKLVEPFHPSM